MFELFNRSEDKPYIFGDVFTHENGYEYTLINPNIGSGYFKDPQNNTFAIVHSLKVEDLFKKGFQPVQEYIEECEKIKEWGLFAPRKLKDNTWAALTPLLTTTAICVDYDEITLYHSRYCFQDSNILTRHENALMWLSRFDNALSLPIGNVAYRGFLGNDPILSPVITEQYHKKLSEIRYNPNNTMSIGDYSQHILDTYALEYTRNGRDLVNEFDSNPRSPYSDNFGKKEF